MITPVSQRWRDRRGTYRPAGEVIVTSHYEVAPVPDDRTARSFVEQHHYSGSYPAARERFGLYWGGLLVGVGVFSEPMQAKVLDALPCGRLEGVELGRLVLLDRVPGNGESWFIARCFELLYRDGYRGVVSFSDPVRRTALDGRVVLAGHIGNVYQASNAIYTGRGTARTLRLLPDGSVLSERALSKIRSGERGHDYAEAILVRHGAKPRRAGEDPRAWLASWLPKVTRAMRHPGNHKYLFGLDRRVRRHLPASLPYPKFILGAAA
jgi:hypothetical protein